MSNRIIRMSEDIDQIVSFLDGLAGSYSSTDARPTGEQNGVAGEYFLKVYHGQGRIDDNFLKLDATLKNLADIIRESVADQRVVEAEITDEMKRFLAETDNYSDRVNPNNLPAPTNTVISGTSQGTISLDGGPRP